MLIAIPLFNDCVSPVLDTAKRLLVVCINEKDIVSSEEISLVDLSPLNIADLISKHATILICGALSRTMSTYLESQGVNVYPWYMGNVESILKIFINGDTPGPEFSMPGCKRNRFGKCNRGMRLKENRSRNYLSDINTVTKRKGRKK